MRRSIASLLAVVMLWTGFVLSAGTVSAHSDPNLGNLHVDAVEITEGKTKFGLGSTIEMKLTFSMVCYALGNPYVLIKHKNSSATIQIPWVPQSLSGEHSNFDTHYFRYTVSGSEPEGEYELEDFGNADNNCRTQNDSDAVYIGEPHNALNPSWVYFNSLMDPIEIDRTKPTVQSAEVDSPSEKYAFKAGEVVKIKVTFSETVNASGTPVITLNNGGQAVYKSVSGSVMNFEYTVQAGQDTLDLRTGSLSGTITDVAGNTLTVPASVTLTSIPGKWIVDTKTPNISVTPTTIASYAREHNVQLQVPDEDPLTLQLWYLWNQNSTTPAAGAINQSDGIYPGQPLPNPSGANGDYYVHIRASDAAGNEAVKTFGPYRFDNTAPTVTFNPDSGRDSEKIAVTVTASDTMSGVKKFSYRWQGTAMDPVDVTGSSAVVETNLIEGQHVLEVTAEDNAGNTQTYTSGQYVIDLTPPQIQFSAQGDDSPARTNQVNVRVDGDAGESGAVYHQWTQSTAAPDENDSNWVQLYSGPLPMSWQEVTTPAGLDGTWFLHVKAVDDAGNPKFDYTKDGFVLDNTAPTVGFSPNGNSVYVQSAEVQLSIDGGNAFEDYEIRYLISQNETESGSGDDWTLTEDGRIELDGRTGIYYLHVRAVDPAGNETFARSQAFHLDVTPPDGSASFPVAYTKERDVELTLDATDESVKPIEFRYRINGGEWSDWLPYAPSQTVTLDDQEGAQNVEVQFRDEAENVSPVREAEIVYDVTPPVYVSHEYSPDGLTNGTVTVKLYYTDNLAPDGYVTESFQENGTYPITFSDPAGNTNTQSITVSNIDKVKPTVTISPNGLLDPRQSAHAEVTVADNVSDPAHITVEWAWSSSQMTAPDTWNLLDEDGVGELAEVDGLWYLWIRATDEAGNVETAASGPFLLDNTPPEATISYNPPTRTAMPVTATITLSEDATVTVPANGSKEYTFAENGTFTFEFVDKAGNVGTATAVVDWIDTSLPQAQVTMNPSGWTNAYIDVTVSAAGDPPREMYGFAASGDAELIDSTEGSEGGLVTAVYRFHENGTLSFTIVDLETGTENTEQILIDKIDRVPPSGTVEYSTTNWTNGTVTAFLNGWDNSNEPLDFIDGGNVGGGAHIFAENGTYTFRFRDKAGNENVATAVVDWIDKDVPQPFVTYSTTGWTKDTVTAAVYFEDASPVILLNPDWPEYIAYEFDAGYHKFTFHENGSFILFFADAAGNEGQVTLQVNWIDRTPPTGTLVYSTREWTRDDVFVTLIASDNSGEAPVFIAGGSEGGGVHRFEENGTYTFIVEDAAGNQSSFTAIVNRIDRTPPEAEIAYSITAPTNGTVRALVTANEPVTVINWDDVTFDFTDNGSFTFEIADRAGNEAEVTATVTWIDRTPPVPSVDYSTTAPTYRDVTATVSANEVFYVINNNRSREHVFRENGEFTFYIQDLAGNVAEAAATVDWIDKTPANITLQYSETAPTRNDVTVTVQSDRPLTFTGEGPTVTFTKNGIAVLQATDNLGRGYNIPIEVTNIDRTAPQVRFTEGSRIVIAQGESFDPMADVQAVDNADGDVTSRITVQHSVNTSVPGEYTILYRVTDTAGNEAIVPRTAEVIAEGRLLAFVNRESAESGDITIRASHVKLDWFGTEGEVTVRWVYGRLQIGEFKKVDEPLPEDGIPIDRQGYYTFLIEDQERRSLLVHVYVIPAL